MANFRYNHTGVVTIMGRILKPKSLWCMLLLCFALFRGRSVVEAQQSAALDRDLSEVTIARLQELYASHKYTVTQVTEWYLDRIARYNGLYKAIQHVDRQGALTTAAAQDDAA